MRPDVTDYDCPRGCSRKDVHVHAEDLSDEEHYTLNWALAFTHPGSLHSQRFALLDVKVKLSDRDKRRIWRKCLPALHEKWGLVSLAKDETGSYVPAQVHLDRLEGGRLVMGDGT